MAEQQEPYESRGSRTDLGEPGGEIPPGHSTNSSLRRHKMPHCERFIRAPRRQWPEVSVGTQSQPGSTLQIRGGQDKFSVLPMRKRRRRGPVQQIAGLAGTG